MNDKDIRKVHVAAADLESIEFERDHAAMDLDEAVSTAVGHGEPVEDVARVANMDAEEVAKRLDVDAPTEKSGDVDGSAEKA
ncbi:hypothetical protein [Arthrobacter pigmenti]